MGHILLGIDPGTGDGTGWSSRKAGESALRFVGSGRVDELFHYIDRLLQESEEEVVAVLEDPNIDTSVFHVNPASLRGASIQEIRKALATAQNVGKCKGVASAVFQFLLSRKVRTVRIAPSNRQRPKSVTADLSPYRYPVKVTREQFFEHTGWADVTNEHSRDAAMLIFDMAMTKFNLLYQTK